MGAPSQPADAIPLRREAAGGAHVAENLAFDQFRARVAQLAPAAKEAVMTIAEELKSLGLQQGLQQGRELGLQQGRELGLQQGLLRGTRETLEKQMTLKFGPLSAAMNTRIQAADIEMLDRWLERILFADTPDAVVVP